jgi:hypothetical protein
VARIAETTSPKGPRSLDIALSERNLITLLSKLYTPGSACTLQVGDTPSGFGAVLVRAEPDELHYAWPTREGAPPGAMHPIAEAVCLIARRAVTAALTGDHTTLARMLETDDAP